MTTTRRLPLVLLAGAALGSPPAGLAQTDPEGPLAALAFMTGCWEGTFESSAGAGVIEEHYTAPSVNLMLGTTRYLRDGAVATEGGSPPGSTTAPTTVRRRRGSSSRPTAGLDRAGRAG